MTINLRFSENRRKSIIFVIAFFCIFLGFHYAEAGEAVTFTDEDLDRYNSSSRKSSTSNSDLNERSYDQISEPAEDKRPKLRHFEIPFTAFEGLARRVIVSVTFNNSVTAPMLLDTGAPGMLISYELADQLNLFDKDNAGLMTSVGGIGGTAPGVISIVDSVQIGEARDSFVPATISASLSNQYRGLIGMDFMASYSVKVDHRKKILVFEELPPTSHMPGGHDEAWWRINFRRFAGLRSEWMQLRNDLDKWIEQRANRDMTVGEIDNISQLKKFVDGQCVEANKLFDKLNGYAIRNSVPMHWREY